jgi:hypothetical protein
MTLSNRTSNLAIQFCGTEGAVSGSSTKGQRGELTVFDSSNSTWSYLLSAVQRNDAGDAIETVNALFPFRLLAADVEREYSVRADEGVTQQALSSARARERKARELTHVKPRLRNPGALSLVIVRSSTRTVPIFLHELLHCLSQVTIASLFV